MHDASHTVTSFLLHYTTRIIMFFSRNNSHFNVQIIEMAENQTTKSHGTLSRNEIKIAICDEVIYSPLTIIFAYGPIFLPRTFHQKSCNVLSTSPSPMRTFLPSLSLQVDFLNEKRNAKRVDILSLTVTQFHSYIMF